jgi:hypothetical protein
MEAYGGSSGDSVSMTKMDGQPFTVIAVEDSNYDDGGNSTPGVKLTTKEKWDNGVNKLHTTRKVIVEFFKQESVRKALAGGDVAGPFVCEKPSGKNYFVMKDA